MHICSIMTDYSFLESSTYKLHFFLRHWLHKLWKYTFMHTVTHSTNIYGDPALSYARHGARPRGTAVNRRTRSPALRNRSLVGWRGE